MTENTPIAHEIKGFFNKALPKGQGGHVLTLGEIHDENAHSTYLLSHIPALKDDHHVGTLGMEHPFFMNVFLWAYQDGTLKKMLGTQEAAKAYLKQIDTALVSPAFRESAKKSIDLQCAAMDAGMRVVYFDARSIFKGGELLPPAAYITQGKAALEAYVGSQEGDPDAVKQRIRSDRHNDPAFKREIVWAMQEWQELCDRHPDYLQRIERMEKLVHAGVAKQIGSDALSATLFRAGNDASRNSITISGVMHINTMGMNEDGKQGRIHGTFPEHVQWIEAEHLKGATVQKAVIATTGQISKTLHTGANPDFVFSNLEPERLRDGWKKSKEYVDDKVQRIADRVFRKEPDALEQAIRAAEKEQPPSMFYRYAPAKDGAPITTVDLMLGVVREANPQSKFAPVPVATRFMKPWALDDDALVKRRMNPLLVAEVKNAFDAVQADWNPDQVVQRGGR